MVNEMTPQTALQAYRFFSVDHADSVLWDRCAQCMNDAEAEALAMAMMAGEGTIEVWDVARFVVKVSSCNGISDGG